MTERIDFTKNDPLFYRDGVAKGGIPIPFVLTAIGSATGDYVDFDGTTSTVISGRLRLSGSWRFISADAYAAEDGTAAKTAAASTEPIITIAYGSAGLLSLADATALATITCDGSGAVGVDVWSPSDTVETQIDEGKDIVAILTTAAASSTSANMDGSAKVVVWLCPEIAAS